MIQVSSIAELRAQVIQWKRAGKLVSFVPTMGNLHEGHIALVDKARELSDVVVTSIFVNPMQFDREEDLQAYPRTLDDDNEKLEAAGCDLVFMPKVNDMYPEGVEVTRVEVPVISELLEGKSRPGHFTGVSTIVNKLFNMVMPDISVFGEKDFQQLMLIRKMVEDLNMPIEIVGLPTVRDKDGLAKSSRNGYLTAEERQIAPMFHRVLQSIVVLMQDGDKDIQSLQNTAISKLNSIGFKADYIEIRRAKDLQEVSEEDYDLVILGSAWLGKARLIDNIPLRLR